MSDKRHRRRPARAGDTRLAYRLLDGRATLLLREGERGARRRLTDARRFGDRDRRDQWGWRSPRRPADGWVRADVTPEISRRRRPATWCATSQRGPGRVRTQEGVGPGGVPDLTELGKQVVFVEWQHGRRAATPTSSPSSPRRCGGSQGVMTALGRFAHRPPPTLRLCWHRLAYNVLGGFRGCTWMAGSRSCVDSGRAGGGHHCGARRLQGAAV